MDHTTRIIPWKNKKFGPCFPVIQACFFLNTALYIYCDTYSNIRQQKYQLWCYWFRNYWVCFSLLFIQVWKKQAQGKNKVGKKFQSKSLRSTFFNQHVLSTHKVLALYEALGCRKIKMGKKIIILALEEFKGQLIYLTIKFSLEFSGFWPLSLGESYVYRKICQGLLLSSFTVD